MRSVVLNKQYMNVKFAVGEFVMTTTILRKVSAACVRVLFVKYVENISQYLLVFHVEDKVVKNVLLKYHK